LVFPEAPCENSIIDYLVNNYFGINFGKKWRLNLLHRLHFQQILQAIKKTLFQSRLTQSQLLALPRIAQYAAEAFGANFKQRFNTRKLIPTEVKTLGGHLLLKLITKTF